MVVIHKFYIEAWKILPKCNVDFFFQIILYDMCKELFEQVKITISHM